MEFRDYGELNIEVETWMQQVMDNRIVKPSAVKKYCKKLINTATETMQQNQSNHKQYSTMEKVLGFAYFYLAEAFFTESMDDKFLKFLLLGLPLLEKHNSYPLLARTYNLLGANAHHHENVNLAVEHYITSLDYASYGDLYYEAGLANTNIGHIFYSMQDFDTAIHFYKKALATFSKHKKNKFYLKNKILLDQLICNSYFYMKKYDIAFARFEKIQENRELYLEHSYSKFSFTVNEVVFFHEMKETEKRDQKIEEAMDILNIHKEELRNVADICVLCEILMDTKRFEVCEALLEQIDQLTKDCDFSNLRLKYLKIKIRYCQETEKEQLYFVTSTEAFHLMEHMEEVNMQNIQESAKMRLDIDKIRKAQTKMQEENRILTIKSETDPLTGLANRNKLNDYAHEAFEKAYRNQTSLAVEILDIDYFKEYNDAYGHLQGDQCLLTIAGLLKKMMNDQIFCARYGGDEFVIIYENMTDEEILEKAEQLKQDIIDLEIENKNSGYYPYITISQGIRNSVPRMGNKVWDYLYVADNCLFHMKKKRKNDICLVHNTKELNATTSGKTV